MHVGNVCVACGANNTDNDKLASNPCGQILWAMNSITVFTQGGHVSTAHTNKLSPQDTLYTPQACAGNTHHLDLAAEGDLRTIRTCNMEELGL